MDKFRVIIFSLLFIILVSSNSLASTLNLGSEEYNFKMTNFNSNQGDYILIDLGYGVDKYRGYSLSIMTPYKQSNQQSALEVEYQFIPESKQGLANKFDYAFKLGLASGNLFDGSDSGVKAGFIIQRALEDKLLYFDGDLISASDIIIDSEIGICGEILEDVLGIIGFKVVANDDEKLDAITGVNFGARMKF